MSLQNTQKINTLLKNWPQGTVCLTSWLVSKGFSNQLLNKYKKGKWLETIGTGAMIRSGDQIGYEAAIHALQQQLEMTIHPGGKTALSMLGKAHYLELSARKVTLFGNAEEKLPTWFRKYDWKLAVEYHQSSFLPPDLGMTEVELKTFLLKVSGAARAMMECLYLAPEKQQLLECYELMEGLNNLRPDLVQQLLAECKSIKVNRLFLYMAEKAGHDWIQYLDLNKIDIGRGKRSLAQNGVYVSKYQITVPKELEEHGKQGL
jgi:hypothetical protein